jgi:hypothetical protein
MRSVWTTNVIQFVNAIAPNRIFATWRRIVNAFVHMSAAAVTYVVTTKFVLAIQTVRLADASIVTTA